MKKFRITLLTIGIVLGFISCNMTYEDPELTKIEITKQANKVEYFVGDQLSTDGLEITATYSDGSIKLLKSDEYTVTGFNSTAAVESQIITISYNEKIATYTVKIKAVEVTGIVITVVNFNWYDTPVAMDAGTNGSYGTDGTYVLYGIWPQEIVPANDVSILELETSTTTVTRGSFTYVKGRDGNYYVKCAENGMSTSYKYSDGTNVKTGGTTFRWFKAEPIKWRVADSNYVDADGIPQGRLLVAENVLIGNIPFFESASDRTISDATIKASNYEHSQVRAYLNGIAYEGTSGSVSTWVDKGFLQSALSPNNIAKTVKVDNSAASTVNFDIANGTATTPDNQYICNNTQDTVFLLSEYEITKYSKNTEKFNEAGSSRVRNVTDFALANYGQIQEITTGSGVYGSFWQLRSPSYMDVPPFIGPCICGVNYQGIPYIYSGSSGGMIIANCPQYGIVPALVVN